MALEVPEDSSIPKKERYFKDLEAIGCCERTRNSWPESNEAFCFSVSGI